ncbi:MAG: hypothetical protein N2V75_00120 [Methanophagales archaeon]|nr:hypothetical protein [Methanophagales archaeon]
MTEEKGEVDWREAVKVAFIGDALDLISDVIPLGKPIGDFIDIVYTLPKIRKVLPEADKGKAYLAAFAEAVPIVEILPNWGLLVAYSYLREKMPRKGEGHKTIFEELELPAPEEIISLVKKKKK